jgi:predicted DsbA family dithiol-disulfide isomerase
MNQNAASPATGSNDPDNALSVDIVSDVMCPWCFIGQKNLEKAQAIAPEIPLRIRWRPYQLDPTLPPGGKDRQKYLEDKFGGPDRAKVIYDRVGEAGIGSGIHFRFDLMNVSPNTLDAHRLIRWAGGIDADTQNKLVRRLFEMFFLEGANIGEHEKLLEAAAFVDMDAKLVADLLASDADREVVTAEIAKSRSMGVTGVPFFIIGNKYALSGAQPAQILADAIRQTDAELKEEAEYRT